MKCSIDSIFDEETPISDSQINSSRTGAADKHEKAVDHEFIDTAISNKEHVAKINKMTYQLILRNQIALPLTKALLKHFHQKSYQG